MSQIINLEQWRQSRRPQRETAVLERMTWAECQANWTTSMMEPTVALWRTAVAGWACLWLAPFGLEVRSIADRAEGQSCSRPVRTGSQTPRT